MKLLRISSLVLLLINGIGGFVGGFALVTDPTGKSIHLCIDCLRHSPFNNYFIPGLLLFLLNGIFTLIVFGAVLIKYRYYPWLITIQGAILTGWIIIQMLLLQTAYFIQFLFGAFGIMLIILGIIQTSSKNPLIKHE